MTRIREEEDCWFSVDRSWHLGATGKLYCGQTGAISIQIYWLIYWHSATNAFANMVRSALLTSWDQNFLNNFMCCYSWVFSNVVYCDFLPRDVMHKRGHCCHPVYVCLSVTFVEHVKTNKHIFEIFLSSGSDTILVFPSQRGCRYVDGNAPNGGIECKGGMIKSRLFHKYLAVSQKR